MLQIIFDNLCAGAVVFPIFFGVPIGLLDGLVLSTLMRIGKFQPRTSTVNRWQLQAISSVVMAVGVLLETTLLGGTYTFTYIFDVALTALIAAIGGLWVAHRVLTHEPRKKKNDESALV